MNLLFFVQPGTNSRSTLLDLMTGFQRAGHQTLCVELEPVWSVMNQCGADAQLRGRLVSQFTAMVRTMLVNNRVDFSVAMWANALTSMSAATGPGNADGTGGPRALSIFDLIPQKHLCYWLDAPQWAHDGDIAALMDTPLGDLLRSPRVYHAINNGATGAEMRDVFRMRNVVAQHYGIDGELFRPHPGRKRYDIVFALGAGDGPPTKLMLDMIDAEEPDVDAIRHEQAERLRPKLAAMIPRIRADVAAAGTLVDSLLRSQLADRHTPMLTRLRAIAAGDPGLIDAATAMTRDPRLFVDITMTIRQVESWERTFTLAYLSRRFRCAAFGNGTEVIKAWNSPVVQLGHLPWHEQSRAYSEGRLGLNVMRWQDDEGLNVKPYEITASGTACLCARRRGIEQLFDPVEEMAVFEGPAQARRLTEELLSEPDRLAGLAEAGRTRTLKDHTWTAVARDLITAING